MKRWLLVMFAVLISGVALVHAQVAPCPVPITCTPEGGCPTPPPCRPPVGGVFTNPEWLKMAYHRVAVEITDQIARTNVDMRFDNDGPGLAEGTFVFPLPLGAVVENLVMYINDAPIEARVLPADEARAVYDAIVRQYRDPALLEYIGTQAVQANVFPIPPGESRRITITYSQALAIDNGLVQYTYPLDVTRLTSSRPVEQTSISVTVAGDQPISNVYSPSHSIAISRGDDGRSFRAGFEASSYVPDEDFQLYFGVETGDALNVNLLTYRESADGDGFFMLLVQPPAQSEAQVAAKDVVLVVDQSGSMDGLKWEQAQEATAYVLNHLNPGDRFNVVLFSTGWRTFSTRLEDASLAPSAADWVSAQEADGGTDINGALTTALGYADAERPLTILFITDGLATEGETNPDTILSNLDAATDNARIFTFGVGDDVDTFLLDSIVRQHRGSSSYVRPSERIDEEVASLYNRISAPVMTNVSLEFEGLTVDTLYPTLPLPDLFAGNQLVIVGRYRDGAEDARIRLSGLLSGTRQTLEFANLTFPRVAGGESFIARLWAARRIGELLNNIRLNGENPELVDSVISLSVRYGIITPYTSFLIDENDILTQSGREEAARSLEAQGLSGATSGANAVGAADAFGALESASAPVQMALPTPTAAPTTTSGGMGFATPPLAVPPAPVLNPLQNVGGKTFILQSGVWTDTSFAPDTMTTEKVVFLSDAYFALLAERPELAEYFALGDRVIVVIDGTPYEVIPE